MYEIRLQSVKGERIVEGAIVQDRNYILYNVIKISKINHYITVCNIISNIINDINTEHLTLMKYYVFNTNNTNIGELSYKDYDKVHNYMKINKFDFDRFSVLNKVELNDKVEIFKHNLNIDNTIFGTIVKLQNRNANIKISDDLILDKVKRHRYRLIERNNIKVICKIKKE